MRSERGLTLAQRSRLSGIGQPAGVHRRHCWVTGPDEDPGPWPGLILDWQQTATGWRAWVVYLVGPDEIAVQAWAERSRLEPAG
jgi:hypothetical protein